MENTSARAPAGKPAGSATKASPSSTLSEPEGTSAQSAPHPQSSMPRSTCFGTMRRARRGVASFEE
eukprot:8251096-Pyramimonas_sp.AAC.1